MKTNKLFSLIGLISVIVISFTVITSCNNEDNSNENINTDQLTTVEIKVEGMTCTGCETHITNAIMELTGINHAKLSHTQGNAIVEFDRTKTSREEIVKAINESGYKAVE